MATDEDARVKFERLRDEALHPGDEKAVARQRDRGKLLARERLEELLPAMRDALAAHCTLGEICSVLREELGTYDARLAP